MRRTVQYFFFVLFFFSSLEYQAQFGTPEVVLPVTSTVQYTELQAADINNDGLVDLVGKSLNVIAFYKNLGDGLFEAPDTIIVAPASINKFILLDSDNDGDIDIWVSNSTQSRLYINQNNSFTPSQSFSSGGNMLKTYDINNDGWLDIITSSAGMLRIFLNNSGTYVLHSTNPLIGNPRDFAFTDIDDDGLIDFVYQYVSIGSQNTSGTGYLLNDGNHNFIDEDELVSNLQIKPRGVEVVDFDLDGDEDILLLYSDMNGNPGGNPQSQSMLLLLEKTDVGTYNQVDLEIQSRPYFRQLHIMDINNDGYPDLLANYAYQGADINMEFYYSGIQMMINNADNTITNQLLHSNQCLPYKGEEMILADITGSGYDDIIFSNAYQLSDHNSPTYFTNNGTLSQGIDNVHYVIPNNKNRGLFASDMNEDGIDEIVQWSSVMENHHHKLKVFTRNSANNYDMHTEHLPAALSCGLYSIQSIVIADLDGNGMKDIIHVRYNGNSNFELIARINEGNGIWTEQSIITSTNSLVIYSSDLDNDDKDELVLVSRSNNHQILIYKYSENETFDLLLTRQ